MKSLALIVEPGLGFEGIEWLESRGQNIAQGLFELSRRGARNRKSLDLKWF